ncbi:MAG: glycosyltransferase 87 family protein [Rhizomicrobium sp.]
MLRFPVVADIRLARLPLVVAVALAAAYTLILAVLFLRHAWIVDSAGHPFFADFVAIWTSGHLALQGTALSAYDGHALHNAELATIGHDAPGYLGWPYPPIYFFVAAAAASLDFTAAFLLIGLATLAAHALVVAAIARDRSAALFACAAPWAFAALYAGQNGFLTAALLGGALLAIPRRPILAGLALGLLTFKPQYGLLFPLALLADGRWRVILSALAATLALWLLAGAVFGFATFGAFFHRLSETGQTLVVEGAVGWHKLQSVYGATRWLGGSTAVAGLLQAAATLAALAGSAVLWRSRRVFALKAAGLAAAAPLATPYVFLYDFPVLAVAVAFLYRERPFDRIEFAALAAALACSVAAAAYAIPSGAVAVPIVLALVGRRAVSRSAMAVSPRRLLPDALLS